MSEKIKLLVCADSPTEFTGFGEVVRNVFKHFPAEVEIHMWAINYDGSKYWDYPDWRLYPTGPKWITEGLGRFLTQLYNGGYTHTWLLNDLNVFTQTDFPAKLRQVCALKKIRSMLYFPVDARLERQWCDIIERVDVAATYTHYAVEQVRAAGCRAPLHVVPHGVGDAFAPQADRKAILREFVIRPTKNSSRPFATPDDFLILNVNKNEWRKDLFRSLEILKALKDLKLPVKMLFRTAPHSAMGGIELEVAGQALGLKLDEDFTHIGPLPPEDLVKFYNAADLYLTTTMGEGWGLGITEALACGCPVALPTHTACGEIYKQCHDHSQEMRERLVALSTFERVFGPGDSRVRVRVDLASAVMEIAEFIMHQKERSQSEVRPALPPELAQWLSWERISKQMQELLFGK